MARPAHLSFHPSTPPDRLNGVRPPSPALPAGLERGRGAASNHSGRFEKYQRETFDDGWGLGAGEFHGGDTLAVGFEPPPTTKTEVTVERPKTIITYNDSPYVGFDRSINPYRGCEHGCVYCFARPSHAYMGYSPGLDFETKLFAKPNAAALLERELARPNYKPRTIAMGTNTDPYQPAEKTYRIMRSILKRMDQFRHPVTILTKSHMVTRDIDLLKPLAERGLTRVMLSITTLDKSLARHMEPRASSPARRLDAIKRLKDAGIPVGVMTAPLIPHLNDDELETLLEKARDAGADYAGYTILRLPREVASLFQEWLEVHAPNRASRILKTIREINGGKIYDAQRSRGREQKSVYTKLISHRFTKAASKLGLAWERKPLDVSQFCPPLARAGQLSLFE